MRIAFVFVDGVGLGPAGPANPLAVPGLEILRNLRDAAWIPPADGGRPDSLPAVVRDTPLPHRGLALATDPSLGIGGLPQSATGQTSILTGENGAAAMGRHMYGYPTPTLQKILMRSSIFKTLAEANRPTAFLNAFGPRFFDLGEEVWSQPLSATTWAVRASGLPFRSFADLQEDRAVFHDIDHASLQADPGGIEPRDPAGAGRIFAREAGELEFSLFEFFQTDKAGHTMDREKADRELLKLERFLAAALDELDLEETTLILTSDHGNIEDLSTKMHTHNPVPTLVFGRGVPFFAKRLDRLENFTPAILEYLGV